MKKYLLFAFFIVISFSVFSQNYPISTVIKGDSVVILTSKQSRSINSTLESQKDKIREQQRSLIDLRKRVSFLQDELAQEKSKFTQDTIRHAALFDSVRIAGNDSLKKHLDENIIKLKLIEDWVIETSVGNAFIYYDWADTTIKVIDLTMYESQFDHTTGSLFLIRRGNNNEYSEFRKRLWQYPESPGKDWSEVNDPDFLPIIYSYPYKIKMKNPFLQDFYKNPYAK